MSKKRSLNKILNRFQNCRSVQEIQKELEKNKLDLDKSPEFVTDFIVSQFVEDVYRNMDEMGISKQELLDRIKKLDSGKYSGGEYIIKTFFEDSIHPRILIMAIMACALEKQIKITLE